MLPVSQLPVSQAEQLILDLVCPFESQQEQEVVPLAEALGRILATTVTGKLDVPHWDNSAMDGYAVRYADVQNCGAEQPITLDIIEEIPAGDPPQKILQPGQAARILTGSMLPVGADTVIMQEETQRTGDQVTIFKPPKPQAYVRHQGEFYRAGDPLLSPGLRLTAPDIAVLATAQCASVPVYRRPKVAILSTGNELVSIENRLLPGQIVDSNQYALAALVTASGGEPLYLGIIPDDPLQLRQAIAQALQSADMILSSGGVSVGDYDYVEQILVELGGNLQIRSVGIKPGKPLTVATLAKPAPTTSPAILYFGLPGNPVSALLTFWRFVQPALRKLSGLAEGWQPTFVKGVSAQNLRSDGVRETYLWGQAKLVEGEFTFDLAGGSSSSGNLINLAQTNAFAVLPVGQREIGAGEVVQIMLVQ